MKRATDVVVVGGGLAGLTAATILGRAGRAVLLLEKASALGGRAATLEKHGFSLNLGAHALYRGGPAARILAELGVPIRGALPPTSGGYAFDRGRLHTLPGGFLSLLTTGLTGLAGKLSIARLLATFGSIDGASFERVPASRWLAEHVPNPDARRLVGALFRLSTYAGDLDRLSAGTAIAQLQLALRSNVLYLHGGWGTLVEGLRERALAAGVEIRTGAKAQGVAIEGGIDGGIEGGVVRGVHLEGGALLPADAVILAAGPRAAHALAPGVAALATHAERLVPVEAACLDLGLSALPRPTARFALGLDRPLYLSVHSATARLAPEGGALIHLAKYGPSGDPEADEAELEDLLDQVQPGWRAMVVERRFLPSLTVCHAVPTAEDGGLAGRPGGAVPGAAGLFLAGDWVGPEGMLADASVASAARAAELCAGAPKREGRALYGDDTAVRG